MDKGKDFSSAIKRFSGDGDDDGSSKAHRRWRRWSRAYLTVQKAKGTPAEAFGSVLYTLLDGTALRAFDQVDMARLEEHGGEEVTYEILDQRYPEEEAHDRIGEVMDTIFDLKVDRGETTGNFTGKVRAAFAAAEAEGISFPSVARGYMLLRFAKVSAERRAVILAAARQSYEERDVAAALRTTYPEGLGSGAPRGVHAVEMETVEEGDDGMTQAVLAAEEFDPFDGEEAVEEQDAIEVLLSWKQTRATINKERISRGLPPGPKPDVKKLEARVRCFRCKQIGHFSRNCPKKQVAERAGKATGSNVNYVFMAWPHGKDVPERRSIWRDGGKHRVPPWKRDEPYTSHSSGEEEEQSSSVFQEPEQPVEADAVDEMEFYDEELLQKQDSWVQEGNQVIRIHEVPRHALYQPRGGCPVPRSELEPERMTIMDVEGVGSFEYVNQWRQPQEANLHAGQLWTGRSIFWIKGGPGGGERGRDAGQADLESDRSRSARPRSSGTRRRRRVTEDKDGENLTETIDQLQEGLENAKAEQVEIVEDQDTTDVLDNVDQAVNWAETFSEDEEGMDGGEEVSECLLTHPAGFGVLDTGHRGRDDVAEA